MMSLFNQLVYHVLIGEIMIYLLTLIPVSYIPIHGRKIALIKLKKITASVSFVWTYRFVAVFMIAVLSDSAVRTYKLSKDTVVNPYDPILNVASQTVDLSLKVKRFYVQRNFYMSLFAVFMLIVLNNRFDLLFRNLELKSNLDEFKEKYNIVKKHNERLVMEYANSPKNLEEMNAKYSPSDSTDDEVATDEKKNTAVANARHRKKSSPTNTVEANES